LPQQWADAPASGVWFKFKSVDNVEIMLTEFFGQVLSSYVDALESLESLEISEEI